MVTFTLDFNEISQLINVSNGALRCVRVATGAMDTVPMGQEAANLEGSSFYDAARQALLKTGPEGPSTTTKGPHRNAKSASSSVDNAPNTTTTTTTLTPDLLMRRQVMLAARAHCRRSGLLYVPLESDPDMAIVFSKPNARHAAALYVLHARGMLLRRFYDGMFGYSTGEAILRIVSAGWSEEDIERLLEAQALQLLTKSPDYADLLKAGHELRQSLLASSAMHRRSFGPWFQSVALPQYANLLVSNIVEEQLAVINRSARPFP
jgi:hypothetical protein